MEANLPNYDKYLQSLELCSKALKIKVKYKDGNGFEGGEYYHHTRVLHLENGLSEATEIACFLHELGHALDQANRAPGEERALSRAYLAFYKGKASSIQKWGVIQCEKSAWRYGETLAKLLKIPLGKWYYKHREYYLKGYTHEDT